MLLANPLYDKWAELIVFSWNDIHCYQENATIVKLIPLLEKCITPTWLCIQCRSVTLNYSTLLQSGVFCCKSANIYLHVWIYPLAFYKADIKWTCCWNINCVITNWLGRFVTSAAAHLALWQSPKNSITLVWYFIHDEKKERVGICAIINKGATINEINHFSFFFFSWWVTLELLLIISLY